MAFRGMIHTAREVLSTSHAVGFGSGRSANPGWIGAGGGSLRKAAGVKVSQLLDTWPLVKQTPLSRYAKDLLTKSKNADFVRSSVVRQNICVICRKVDDKLTLLSIIFAKQCNQILALRVRRATQITNFYSKLGYDKDTLTSLIQKIGLSFARQMQYVKNGKSIVCLFSTVGLFNWKEGKIQDQELSETAGEISLIQLSTSKSKQMNIDGSSSILHGWEKVMDRDTLSIYRKPLADSSHLYEYKVFGTFNDIPARAFFNTQLDLEYRKQWDKFVVKLDIIDRDEKSGTEIVQWITHFPYPMYKREYIYLRRTQIDQRQKVMVIVSRHTEHPQCPLNNSYVRVNAYVSKMVIKPHSNSFDENGFDYILTYHDDPKSSMPSMAYNWAASTGVPDFLEKIHVAARNLHEKRKGVRPHEDIDYQKGSSGGIPM